MAITRWNPVTDMLQLHRDLSRFVNGFTPSRARDEEYETASWSPTTDIVEDPDKYVLMFDLPGVSKKDIKVNFADNELVVSGDRNSSEEYKDQTCHRVEREFGKFYRRFTFPRTVDASNIGAQYVDGVLTLTVPKAEENKPKAIEIH